MCFLPHVQVTTLELVGSFTRRQDDEGTNNELRDGSSGVEWRAGKEQDLEDKIKLLAMIELRPNHVEQCKNDLAAVVA